jgi:hypothetical protein
VRLFLVLALSHLFSETSHLFSKRDAFGAALKFQPDLFTLLIHFFSVLVNFRLVIEVPDFDGIDLFKRQRGKVVLNLVCRLSHLEAAYQSVQRHTRANHANVAVGSFVKRDSVREVEFNSHGPDSNPFHWLQKGPKSPNICTMPHSGNS